MNAPIDNNTTTSPQPGSARAHTFWRIVTKLLFVMLCPLFLVRFSMYWWPDMPSSPRPSEGRIYPLNNHDHYTYMNEKEHLFDETFWWVFPAGVFAIAVIQFFVDPSTTNVVRVRRVRRLRGHSPPLIRSAFLCDLRNSFIGRASMAVPSVL